LCPRAQETNSLLREGAANEFIVRVNVVKTTGQLHEPQSGQNWYAQLKELQQEWCKFAPWRPHFQRPILYYERLHHRRQLAPRISML
jgi:hypothetical protein